MLRGNSVAPATGKSASFRCVRAKLRVSARESPCLWGSAEPRFPTLAPVSGVAPLWPRCGLAVA